ncbi:NUDIX domain-containing protein [Mycobacterium sp. M1]|uniref:NUDIX domain-containing protein n=1 Tax=Mycolicibacter acidiphilus TaxID=2835306 RepID=A0ABS5RJ75_9MYCO|nr:NUDIX domain-containing protein [Mycolicibacter acidiphilus]MBS9533664.1 NUDIX domain-containing protein [Mycolicibacter acidiphilus]
MPVPAFIAALRTHVGHTPLWLIGTTAVVIRDDHVLLVQRADNSWWTPVTGIVDPGEEPADAACREVTEETGVRAEPVRLAWVHTTPLITHVNGDQAQYLDHTFLMRWVAGEPYPADDESTAARGCALDALPEMPTHMHRRITAALGDEDTTRFEWSRPTGWQRSR